jgi:hypothetical protein
MLTPNIQPIFEKGLLNFRSSNLKSQSVLATFAFVFAYVKLLAPVYPISKPYSKKIQNAENSLRFFDRFVFFEASLLEEDAIRTNVFT